MSSTNVGIIIIIQLLYNRSSLVTGKHIGRDKKVHIYRNSIVSTDTEVFLLKYRGTYLVPTKRLHK